MEANWVTKLGRASGQRFRRLKPDSFRYIVQKDVVTISSLMPVEIFCLYVLSTVFINIPFKLGMMEKFGSDPKDKEVCVVYEGEEVSSNI